MISVAYIAQPLWVFTSVPICNNHRIRATLGLNRQKACPSINQCRAFVTMPLSSHVLNLSKSASTPSARESFDTLTHESLKHYVYALFDPLENAPFYIGKGVGDRVFHHANLSKSLNEAPGENLRLDKIKMIHGRTFDNRVDYYFLRHGMTHDEARLVEAVLIQMLPWLQVEPKIELANKVQGWNTAKFGLMTEEEIRRQYQATPLYKFDDNVVIVNLNSHDLKNKGQDEVYEAAKGNWAGKLSRLNQADIVLAEQQGIIIGVFEIEPCSADKTKWKFEGTNCVVGYSDPSNMSRRKKENFSVEAEAANRIRTLKDAGINASLRRIKRYSFNRKRMSNPAISERYLYRSVGHSRKGGDVGPLWYFQAGDMCQIRIRN